MQNHEIWYARSIALLSSLVTSTAVALLSLVQYPEPRMLASTSQEHFQSFNDTTQVIGRTYRPTLEELEPWFHRLRFLGCTSRGKAIIVLPAILQLHLQNSEHHEIICIVVAGIDFMHNMPVASDTAKDSVERLEFCSQSASLGWKEFMKALEKVNRTIGASIFGTWSYPCSFRGKGLLVNEICTYILGFVIHYGEKAVDKGFDRVWYGGW